MLKVHQNLLFLNKDKMIISLQSYKKLHRNIEKLLKLCVNEGYMFI